MKEADISKVLIFGGSGFIGTNLVLDLIGRGVDLHVYDLKPPKIMKSINIEHRANLIIRDFTKEKDF